VLYVQPKLFFFCQGWRTIQLRNPNEDPNSLRLDFWRFFHLIFGINRKESTATRSSRVSLDKAHHAAPRNPSVEEGSTLEDSNHMSMHGGVLGRSFYADPTRFFGRKPGEADIGQANSIISMATDAEGASGVNPPSASDAKHNWSDQVCGAPSVINAWYCIKSRSRLSTRLVALIFTTNFRFFLPSNTGAVLDGI